MCGSVVGRQQDFLVASQSAAVEAGCRFRSRAAAAANAAAAAAGAPAGHGDGERGGAGGGPAGPLGNGATVEEVQVGVLDT